MPVDKLCASYILRLTQRLSRLSFELHDVRTGRTHRFDSAAALSSFLDASATDHPTGARPQDELAAPGSHHHKGTES